MTGTSDLQSRKYSWSGGKTTITDVWHCYFLDAFDIIALGENGEDFGCPGKLDAFSGTSLYPNSVSVELVDESVRFGTIVTPGVASYQIVYQHSTYESFSVMPWNRPADIEWEAGTDVSEVCYADIDDNPIVNSAGDFYDPLPTRPVRGGKVRISYALQSNPGNALLSLAKTCNASAFFGAGARTGYLASIGSRRVVEVINGESITYYQVTAEIQFSVNKWNYVPIDNGCRILNDDGDLVAYRDKSGEVVTSPVLLDGEGGYNDDPTNPVTYPDGDGYKIIEEADWSALNLPNPF